MNDAATVRARRDSSSAQAAAVPRPSSIARVLWSAICLTLLAAGAAWAASSGSVAAAQAASAASSNDAGGAAEAAPGSDVSQPSGIVVPLSSAARMSDAAAARSLADRAPGPSTFVDAGRRFDLIGALVRGRDPARVGVTVRVRASLDGSSWSEWLELEFPPSPGEPGSALSVSDRASEPVWVGVSRYLEIALEGSDAAVAGVAARLRLAFVTSPWDEAEAPDPATDAAATAAADAATTDSATDSTTDSATDSTTATARGIDPRMPARPNIVTRSKWGANESWRNDGPYYGRVRMIFIHHTVSSNSYSQSEAKAIVRSVYYYHTRVLGWNDIGYNFLVDRFGTVYEGRYGGMTRSVEGAQTLGFNGSSCGVSMIGTFTSARPSAAMLSNLEHLLAWKLDVHHINPLATVGVRCEYSEKFSKGATVRFNVISGHRQANYTTCPGDGIFSQISAIRSAVGGIGNPKIYGPKATPAEFSPNGDDVRETVTITAALSRQASWKVEVRNNLNEVVRTFSGSGTAVSATWNGRNDSGDPALDGRYTCVVSAENESGRARIAVLAVRRDGGAPQVHTVTASPALISPNGDHRADTTSVRFTAVEPCQARILLFDGGGNFIGRVSDWKTARVGVNAVTWNGTVFVDGARAAVRDGSYLLRVEVRDPAGNIGSAVGNVSVNSTLANVVATVPYFSPNGDGVQDVSAASFRLTKTATVTVSVVSGNEALRTWSLGSLGSGTHQVRWDGSAGSGDAASGPYAFVVTATNTVGKVSMRTPVRIDRTRPRVSTTASAATVRRGATYTLGYTVSDAFSPKARVRFVVRNAVGVVVKKTSVGWWRVNKARTWPYEASKRGVFTISVLATDMAGNPQYRVAKLVLTVK